MSILHRTVPRSSSFCFGGFLHTEQKYVMQFGPAQFWSGFSLFLLCSTQAEGHGPTRESDVIVHGFGV